MKRFEKTALNQERRALIARLKDVVNDAMLSRITERLAAIHELMEADGVKAEDQQES